jgi:two-component system, LytTR family, response regulator
MITCAIIDDEPPAIEILEKYVQRVPFLQHVASYDSSVDAALVLKTKPVDLIFLDIHMPELSGLQMAKLLNRVSKVIFTTAHRQYALDAYEHQVVDYLLKPIAFERFLAAVQKVQEGFAQAPPMELAVKPTEKENEPHIFVKTNNKIIRILLKDLFYLEGLGNYVTLHTLSERLVIHGSIKDFEAHLPTDQFMRVHKSYLISVKHIKSVEGNQIFLENPLGRCEIPLGAAYRAGFLRYVQHKMVN